MALEYDRTAPIYDNTNVDNIVDQEQGQIDEFAYLSFDMPDKEIIKSLNWRINDSEAYWNDAKGHDLKNARAENTRLHLGRVDETGLYKHQKQYKENQIFIAEESIVAYVTAQIAGPLVKPAGKDDSQKSFASNLEKAIKVFCEDNNLESIVELSVRNILNKRIAITHFYYDKVIDDIVMQAEDPEHHILDKNCALGKNPGFHCAVMKRTPEELIAEYPDQEEKIMQHEGIQRKTPKQMQKELAVRKVYVTHYDDEGKPQEGKVVYYGNIVLEKNRNPNYLYAKKDLNLVKFPKKPFIYGNLVNYGTHLIDNTTPLEQAAPMQLYLMRRGRQIAENADKANGILVIGTSSGLSKDDGQNITGDPNQKLFVDDSNAKSVEDMVMQLEAKTLPDYVINDKQDARMQIGNLMGAPTDFTGAEAEDGDPTLGQVMIKKNQAAGRQDLMVRAITRMLSEIYEYITQMFLVWYTDDNPRDFTYDGGDGEFDFVTFKRSLMQKGIKVRASKPANPDRSRIEAIVLQLLKEKAISLLDAYKILQLENAQQLYDNWAKQTKDPMSLSRDALDAIDTTEAEVVLNDFLAGKPVEEKDNPSKEYILALRKVMINDDFLKAKHSIQTKFIKYINKCLDSLEQRLALEEASEIGPPTGKGLRPGAKLPDPNLPPPTAPGIPGQPGAQPGQPLGPPQMPPGQGMPMQGQPMQAGGIPAPQPMTPSSVFSNTPIPQPGAAPVPQPGNPGSLPMV